MIRVFSSDLMTHRQRQRPFECAIERHILLLQLLQFKVWPVDRDSRACLGSAAVKHSTTEKNFLAIQKAPETRHS